MKTFCCIMNKTIPALLAGACLLAQASAMEFTTVPDWLKLPEGRPKIGDSHGDVYVTDGYASDYVHRFDRAGLYLKSFGGRKEPYGFKTLHKIAIDPRFEPARIIGCDRANMRVVHLSLEGEFLGVVAKDLLLP